MCNLSHIRKFLKMLNAGIVSNYCIFRYVGIFYSWKISPMTVVPWRKTLCGYWYRDILQKVGGSHLKFNFKKVSINIDKLLSMTGFKHILCFDLV